MSVNHNIPEFTVAEFSRSIKRVFEDNFGYIRIKGEISGFKKASSGHLYFNLKDETAVINAVCFRGSASLINFDVADGLEVIVSGRVTIYEGRSTYQIIVEKVEIAGIGAIMAAIEKRRIKLLEQGYFDEKNKKPLPFLPKVIGVITSPTGAVIEDIMHRIQNRFPVNLLIYPATMQGKNSATEVIQGIKYFNQKDQVRGVLKVDIIIIARGGGSFEDLLPFNDEDLVKAVFNSHIPIISAVGHETDTTLIDYAADVRAPTPSAAAEMAVPVLKDLQALTNNLSKRLQSYFANFIAVKTNDLEKKYLIHPQQKLLQLQEKLLNLTNYLKQGFVGQITSKQQQLKSFILSKPNYENCQNRLNFLVKNLAISSNHYLQNYQNKIVLADGLLQSYDYKNVLQRGYAIVRNANQDIVDRKTKIKNYQKINIEVMDGDFNAIVCEAKSTNVVNKVDDQLPTLFDNKIK